MAMTVNCLGAQRWSIKTQLEVQQLKSETHTRRHAHTPLAVTVSYPEPPVSRWSGEWPPGGSSEWVLLLKFSRDCRKERRARSSSRGDVPSSSTTSAISAKVTGCVLKRVSRDRRERLRPCAGPLGTGKFWGNSSRAEARRWHPVTSTAIWRTAAILSAGVEMRCVCVTLYW